MARSAWRFIDPITDEEYAWPVNPREDSGSHAITRSTNYAASAAQRRTSAGVDTIDNVIFQKNMEQQVFSYTGYVYTVEQYNALQSWADKNYAVELYDDLGRGFLVYTTEVNFSRVRSNMNPYKHNYTFNGIILEELTSGPSISFSADPGSGTAPLSVDFVDLSTDSDGYIVSWFWDFDDGDTSTEESPTHIYTDPGTYYASLTVTDNDGYTANVVGSIEVS